MSRYACDRAGSGHSHGVLYLRTQKQNAESNDHVDKRVSKHEDEREHKPLGHHGAWQVLLVERHERPGLIDERDGCARRSGERNLHRRDQCTVLDAPIPDVDPFLVSRLDQSAETATAIGFREKILGDVAMALIGVDEHLAFAVNHRKSESWSNQRFTERAEREGQRGDCDVGIRPAGRPLRQDRFVPARGCRAKRLKEHVLRR